MGYISILVFCSAFSLCWAQTLLLAGGALKDGNTEFWNTFINLAGGKKDADIGLITAGYLDAQEQAAKLKETLQESYGVASVTWIPVTVNDTGRNNSYVEDLATSMTGVFIAGGNQEWIIHALQNTDGTDSHVLGAIRTMFRNGGVVAGTSAGAMVLSSAPLLVHAAATDSHSALVHGCRQVGSRPDRPNGCLYLEKGLGFFDGYMVDTHYSERGAEGRLTRVLLDTLDLPTGVKKGLGIDENMGLVIYNVGEPDEYAEVIGNTNGVSVVDVTHSKIKPSTTTDVSNVQMSFLTEDDMIAMMSGELTPASWKTALHGQEWNFFAESTDDIFSKDKRGEFRRVAKSLFDSLFNKHVTSFTQETDPRFEVVMSKIGAKAFHNDSPTSQKHLISLVNMKVAIHEKK